MEWNSSLYDKKHDFVAEYGKGLLEFVAIFPLAPNSHTNNPCGFKALSIFLTMTDQPY